MKILDLAEIRRRLQDRKLAHVAEKTGLHYNTVSRIARGETLNPSYAVLQSLADYLTEGDEARG